MRSWSGVQAPVAGLGGSLQRYWNTPVRSATKRSEALAPGVSFGVERSYPVNSNWWLNLSGFATARSTVSPRRATSMVGYQRCAATPCPLNVATTMGSLRVAGARAGVAAGADAWRP